MCASAAALADEADAAALAHIRAGADEGDILAAQHAAIFRGGGDYPGNEFIIGSGRRRAALPLQGRAGARSTTRDQITLEFAGAYRHYHAAIMRTVPVGDPRPAHLAYHRAAREALLACEAELRPGRTAGDVFAAHARVLDEHGLARAPPQRLRLLARRQVHAVLDGLADVLRGQPVGDRSPAWCCSRT